jgi:hypothetical protein
VVEQLGVCVLTSQEKWVKMRRMLEKWKAVLKSIDLRLSHKELLADQGFLVYVTHTYPAMVLYLKGFHLTTEMWRGGRDAEGWKQKNHDEHSVSTMVGEGGLVGDIEDEDEAVVNH